MATLEQAQGEVISRGMRFDAASETKAGFIAHASSEDARSGKRTNYSGKGITPEDAYAELIGTLPAKPDPNAALCPMCHQPLPGAFNSGRYDAP